MVDHLGQARRAEQGGAMRSEGVARITGAIDEAEGDGGRQQALGRIRGEIECLDESGHGLRTRGEGLEQVEPNAGV